MNIQRIFIFAPLFLAVSILLAGEGDVAQIGDVAPVFTATASDGTSVSLDSFKGKVVLLGFFATWCGGCVAEMPRVERELHQKYKDAGLVVLEVGRGHTYYDLARFKRSHGFSFTILEDPRRAVYNKYATDYIPRCYLIGKDGRVKFAMTGTSESDFAEMKRRAVEELGVANMAGR